MNDNFRTLANAVAKLEEFAGKQLDVSLQCEHDELYICVKFYCPNNLTKIQVQELDNLGFILDEVNLGFGLKDWEDPLFGASSRTRLYFIMCM